MAVLIEAISVVVRSDRLVGEFPGGWAAFKSHVPNSTLCADEELVRVGFMHPGDAEAYVAFLKSAGLRYLLNYQATDLVVVDQMRGFMAPCDWACFGHVHLNGDPAKRVSACMLKGSSQKRIIMPEGWIYEQSLSASYGFVADGAEDTMEIVADDDGLQTLLSPLSEQPLYTARTPKSGEKLRGRNLWRLLAKKIGNS